MIKTIWFKRNGQWSVCELVRNKCKQIFHTQDETKLRTYITQKGL